MPYDIVNSLNGSERDMVLTFHKVNKIPNTNVDTITDDRLAMRLGLLVEELKELFEDGFNITLDISYLTGKNVYYNIKDALSSTGIRNLAGIADAQADIAYVNHGLAIELDYNLSEVFKEVHASNMTKLDNEGNPILRADGKILKGPNFIEPNIEKAINVS